ncbi:NAD(P)-dependent oxidoreductase [Streptomyces sp. NPDC056716]|uniref:NAD(P)-dependent oxidoreductase n=1 Tax=unclassified Streptomyces TaxID=2593676 RepID=UPI00369BE5B4
MDLLVLGATGATGRLLIDQALAAGHGVRALVRSPQKLTTTHARLEVITGQATDASDVARAMTGMDAVISALGANKGTVITDATNAVIGAAGSTGVTRFVEMSSFAVLTGRLSRPAKAITGMTMAAIIKDKTAAEAALSASDLDWTVVHAVRLTNGPATGTAKQLSKDTTLRMGDTIARADVAAWMIAAAQDGAAHRRSVVLAG